MTLPFDVAVWYTANPELRHDLLYLMKDYARNYEQSDFEAITALMREVAPKYIVHHWHATNYDDDEELIAALEAMDNAPTAV